jgi:hypothetical protein
MTYHYTDRLKGDLLLGCGPWEYVKDESLFTFHQARPCRSLTSEPSVIALGLPRCSGI